MAYAVKSNAIKSWWRSSALIGWNFIAFQNGNSRVSSEINYLAVFALNFRHSNHVPAMVRSKK